MTEPEKTPSLKDLQEQHIDLAKAETASRPVRRWRVLLFQVYLLVSILGFAALTYLASTRPVLPLDLSITLEIQTVQAAWFSALMRLVSWPGFGPQVLLIVMLCTALLYWFDWRWEALVSALCGVSALTANTLIKLAIARPRPAPDLVHVFRELSSFSFPSGHVMFYSAYFGFLWFLAFTLLRHSWKRTALLGFLAALVLLVGPSRIYLGQHWASDVLGAYLIGGVILAGAVWVYQLKPGWAAGKPGEVP